MHIKYLHKLITLTLVLILSISTTFCQQKTLKETGTSDEINLTKPDSLHNEKKPWFIFNIFPNPNSGEFCIEFENMTPSLQINIYDVKGKKIKSVYNVSRRNEISLSNCASGIYVVKISDEKQVSSRQIVIQR